MAVDPSALSDARLASLEEPLGYRFSDRSRLRQALVHRSYLSEHEGEESNERLEFLGDAVLQLAVTDFLFDRFPQLPEGDMAKVRAGVVNAVTLAALAERLGVGEHLLLGKGEEATGGRVKDSILADAMEAVLGAVYLDSGYERVRQVILDLVGREVAQRVLQPGWRDYKTRLQEVLAKQGLRPVYQSRAEGPEHLRSFTASVAADGRELGRGLGPSKKRAEQRAAEEALRKLGEL
ncbi:MAG: ribonuclease III [Actinomycetota bacterium]|nr:ribonuclease III [Actinomycetota bacterium]